MLRNEPYNSKGFSLLSGDLQYVLKRQNLGVHNNVTPRDVTVSASYKGYLQFSSSRGDLRYLNSFHFGVVPLNQKHFEAIVRFAAKHCLTLSFF